MSKFKSLRYAWLGLEEYGRVAGQSVDIDKGLSIDAGAGKGVCADAISAISISISIAIANATYTGVESACRLTTGTCFNSILMCTLMMSWLALLLGCSGAPLSPFTLPPTDHAVNECWTAGGEAGA
ncbi:hypothetical protein AWZ03_009993 [Drosophila navojoa]|uniref:Uncharacterized protein n=1 Tax=Drosophila navojoa TaxID=7232 RepID=A0A484B3Z9_DRONA|nr:hypothetical protein AWZ03_009993 [Drosophila navojoa]